MIKRSIVVVALFWMLASSALAQERSDSMRAAIDSTAIWRGPHMAGIQVSGNLSMFYLGTTLGLEIDVDLVSVRRGVKAAFGVRGALGMVSLVYFGIGHGSGSESTPVMGILARLSFDYGSWRLDGNIGWERATWNAFDNSDAEFLHGDLYLKYFIAHPYFAFQLFGAFNAINNPRVPGTMLGAGLSVGMMSFYDVPGI